MLRKIHPAGRNASIKKSRANLFEDTDFPIGGLQPR